MRATSSCLLHCTGCVQCNMMSLHHNQRVHDHLHVQELEKPCVIVCVHPWMCVAAHGAGGLLVVPRGVLMCRVLYGGRLLLLLA
jgi:hypothetical protein